MLLFMFHMERGSRNTLIIIIIIIIKGKSCVQGAIQFVFSCPVQASPGIVL